jgi:hypothetical protein
MEEKNGMEMPWEKDWRKRATGEGTEKERVAGQIDPAVGEYGERQGLRGKRGTEKGSEEVLRRSVPAEKGMHNQSACARTPKGERARQKREGARGKRADGGAGAERSDRV